VEAFCHEQDSLMHSALSSIFHDQQTLLLSVKTYNLIPPWKCSCKARLVNLHIGPNAQCIWTMAMCS